jgi:chlorobactene glucosyltransferase
MVNVMDILAGITLCWHGANFAVIFKNWKSFLHLSDFNAGSGSGTLSVLVPARNEENTIGNLLESLASQRVTDFEVIICNDHSTDRTAEIARSFTPRLRNLSIIQPPPRPDGWMGKNWACHQLSLAATGDYLLFADADVTFAPEAIAESIHAAATTNHGLITVWPRQELHRFREKSALTTMYFTLLAFLPANYTHTRPLWMPAVLYQRFKALFAAACGQFMLFRRECYDRIGGHAAVAGNVIDDVALAKNARNAGFTVLMLNGTGSVSCRMYETDEALFQGFRKNFFAGFGYSYIGFLSMGLVHLLVYTVPVAGLFAPAGSKMQVFAVVSLLFIVASRALFLHMYAYPARWIPLAWSGVLWFQRLAVTCIADRLLKRQITWKNRFYQH